MLDAGGLEGGFLKVDREARLAGDVKLLCLILFLLVIPNVVIYWTICAAEGYRDRREAEIGDAIVLAGCCLPAQLVCIASIVAKVQRGPRADSKFGRSPQKDFGCLSIPLIALGLVVLLVPIVLLGVFASADHPALGRASAFGLAWCAVEVLWAVLAWASDSSGADPRILRHLVATAFGFIASSFAAGLGGLAYLWAY